MNKLRLFFERRAWKGHSYFLLFLFLHLPLCSIADYSIKFIFTTTDSRGEVVYSEAGVLDVKGIKYRVEIPEELLIVGNNSIQWLYQIQNEEIVISNSEISDQLANIRNIEELVNLLVSFFVGQIDENNRLEFVKDSTGQLVDIKYHAGRMIYHIKLEEVTENANIPDTKFTFDVGKYRSAIVTDLR